VTVFVGCGFAAKYRDGGGNLSVPLQWMLGLRRLKLDAVWLELLPATGDEALDRANVEGFQRRMREHGLAGRYCLLLQKPATDTHDLSSIECIGLSRKALETRMAHPNILLNLSYSIHPPLLTGFERRFLCDLDPSEIFFWMTKLEMGQSFHDEFWTIGLNVDGSTCRLPRPGVSWKTFYPLVDTQLLRKSARPDRPKFTTIGQWYWDGAVEVDGGYPDLSKRFAFTPYLDLPRMIPGAQFELAMNIGDDRAEASRLTKKGWRLVDPHTVARTPGAYRRYLESALGEFTAIKGVDVSWQTGWVSDRAAAFMALGRPVITEDTGAGAYLPKDGGMLLVRDAEMAAKAIGEVMTHWERHSRAARACAVEIFDSVRNLRRILAL